jgi:hypothetical protein
LIATEGNKSGPCKLQVYVCFLIAS